MGKRATILVVDDENGVRQSFNMSLKDGYNVLLAATGKEAIDIFTATAVDLILLDIRLPDIHGLDLLGRLKELDPNTEIIMVTAVKEIQSAVKAIKLGAYEYVVKPFMVADVLILIERALEKSRLVKEVAYLRNELERHKPFEKMVGRDKKMRDIFDLISTVSESDGTVLIQGESGTGKELVARAIHNRSPRKNDPFIVINCAAIPSGLMESELFGYYKGAFTGASRTTMGKIEMAGRGTVFLDDINTLDLNMQAKLLRVIQEKELERLGGAKVINVDVRFVAASNRDLGKMISEQQFREDLYYRLNVFPIKLPPLRERRADIPLLLNYFLERHARKTGRPAQRFSAKATTVLTRYDWPGNVREIENLIERLATINRKAVIDVEDMSSPETGLGEFKGMELKDAVKAFEKKYISEVLQGTEGSRKNAAEALGIHRNTLLMKMNELGIRTK